MQRYRYLRYLPVLMLGMLAASCGSDRPADTGAAAEPAAAVLLLGAHLRSNDLQAFVHAAVPPELQPALARAWHDGRTRWPLEELPFDQKIPGMLELLAAPQAESRLQHSFDRQFANANGEIRSAATALGLFGTKFIQTDAELSEEERAHYAQLIACLSAWAKTAKLGDPQRGRRAIVQLTAAARLSGLQHDADFARLGMEETLHRLGPFLASFKRALNEYGLDLDQSFEKMSAMQLSQEGDSARVRMRYPLAGTTIDTVVVLERVGGRWYLRDYLRHARTAAAQAAPAAPVIPATPASNAPRTSTATSS